MHDETGTPYLRVLIVHVGPVHMEDEEITGRDNVPTGQCVFGLQRLTTSFISLESIHHTNRARYRCEYTISYKAILCPEA
ncbi:hypothetical protein FRC11_011785 [Ceratobasidium sp. 423]|nr:hypothetical protein FRC11_011785 [Ceratobasidium sp. 423]